MTFDWREYLPLAKHLINDPGKGVSEEARLRTAASRCYYAAFCVARNAATARGASVPTAHVHKFVIDFYRQSTAVRDRQVALWLDRLRVTRIDADYEDRASVTALKAQLACLMSEELLRHF